MRPQNLFLAENGDEMLVAHRSIADVNSLDSSSKGRAVAEHCSGLKKIKEDRDGSRLMPPTVNTIPVEAVRYFCQVRR